MDVRVFPLDRSVAFLTQVEAGSELPGGTADLAFAVALLEIETLDGAIADRLASMQHLNELRKAYADRIGVLQQAAEAFSGDGTTEVRSGIGIPEDFVWDPAADGGRGGVVPVKAEDGRPPTREELDALRPVTKESLNDEIQRLRDQMDNLSSDSEIGMLGLNRLLSRRNQILQLTSNVMSSEHQTAMGIIANMKV